SDEIENTAACNTAVIKTTTRIMVGSGMEIHVGSIQGALAPSWQHAMTKHEIKSRLTPGSHYG
ncbi:MAG: hypothetical protein VX929_10855, partial [Pseudomonadota bacterium]|nr:hypothetical protein [Pseudomonadota bacterium]